MAKPIGTSGLRIRHAPNKEWGIWRKNDEKIPYLILTLPTIEEAVKLGKELGRVLNLTCEIIRSKFY